jgi:hypothetical protein
MEGVLPDRRGSRSLVERFIAVWLFLLNSGWQSTSVDNVNAAGSFNDVNRIFQKVTRSLFF